MPESGSRWEWCLVVLVASLLSSRADRRRTSPMGCATCSEAVAHPHTVQENIAAAQPAVVVVVVVEVGVNLGASAPPEPCSIAGNTQLIADRRSPAARHTAPDF